MVSRVHTILLVVLLLLIALLLAFTLSMQDKVDSRALDLYQSTIFSHVSKVSTSLHDVIISLSSKDKQSADMELEEMLFSLNNEGMVERVRPVRNEQEETDELLAREEVDS
jgi:hypothetical protein